MKKTPRKGAGMALSKLLSIAATYHSILGEQRKLQMIPQRKAGIDNLRINACPTGKQGFRFPY
jgi:hypothetical protein